MSMDGSPSDVLTASSPSGRLLNALPVVTGMGVFVPTGASCQDLAVSLKEMRDSIKELDWPELDGFIGRMGSVFPDDELALGFTDDDMGWMDRATFLTVRAWQEALASSKINLSDYSPDRIAIVLGSSHSGLIRTEEVAKAFVSQSIGDWSLSERRKFAATLVAHCSWVLGRLTGATGRVMTVSSACASSNSAVGIGADLIRTGEADLVIAGGSDTVSLSVLAGFNALRALSAEKTGPFSPTIGLNLGEGAGIVTIESANAAAAAGRKAVFSVAGYGLSGDAHHATAPSEDGAGAALAMTHAMKQAQAQPDGVDYINAHGTGTDSNDSAEAAAYRAIFDGQVPVSSLKSFYGHTLGASGVVELISTALLTSEGLLPAGLRQDEVREGCEGVDYVNGAPRPAQVSSALVNNYGFGGNNSSICIDLEAKGQSEAVLDRGVVVSGTGFQSAFSERPWRGHDAPELSQDGGYQVLKAPKMNFRTPELKQFARTSAVSKLSISALGEAIGPDTELYDHNPKAGLLSGLVFGAQKPTEKFMESVFDGDPSLANAHFFPMTTMNATGGQCSIAYGITGFTTTLCGSAAALCYGLDLVRYGRQDRMTVVSADETTERLMRSYDLMGAYTETHFTEAGAAIAFEADCEMQARHNVGRARITGWANRQDPVDIGPDPGGQAMTRALRLALDQAGIAAQDVTKAYRCAAGSRAVKAAVQRGANRVFGRHETAGHENLAETLGLLPSSGPLMHLVAAIDAVEDGAHGPVVAYGSDVCGDCFAFVVEPVL